MISKQYQEALERRIMQVLADGGRTFEDLLPHLRGAFPSIVEGVLDESVRIGRLELTRGVFHCPESTRAVAIESAPEVASAVDDLWRRLPESHPLNFEWYWDNNTLDYLRTFRDWAGLRVAFLGCPRLFAHFALTVSARRMLLIDINERLLAILRGYLPASVEFVVHDAFLPVPDGLHGQFDAILMDPPWYPAHTKAWLARAFELLEEGWVYFSLFPELTREKARQERQGLLSFIEATSIEKVKIELGVLGYLTPDFEQNTLASLGLNIERPWRYSDLVSGYRPKGARLAGSLYEQASHTAERWESFTFDRQVVAVKAPQVPETAHLELRSLYPDGSFVYRSVSLRDPLRRQIGLWTSRNKVFSVKGATILCDLFALLKQREERSHITTKVSDKWGVPTQEVVKTLDMLDQEVFRM